MSQSGVLYSRSLPQKPQGIKEHALKNYIEVWLYPTYLQKRQGNVGFYEWVKRNYPQYLGIGGSGKYGYGTFESSNDDFHRGESMLNRKLDYWKNNPGQFNPYESDEDNSEYSVSPEMARSKYQQRLSGGIYNPLGERASRFFRETGQILI